MTKHVLVLCTHSSARSVLAEGMLGHLARQMGIDVRAHSAGSAPSGRINPLALDALQQAGVSTEGFRSKSWDEFSGEGAPPIDVVITVCDSAAAEACPVFFGGTGGAPARVHWGYPDPSNAPNGDAGRRQAFELTRQALAYRMLRLLGLPLQRMDRASLQAALDEIGRS